MGSAIAGWMWNNILEKELYNPLPQESKHLSASIEYLCQFGDEDVVCGWDGGMLLLGLMLIFRGRWRLLVFVLDALYSLYLVLEKYQC